MIYRESVLQCLLLAFLVGTVGISVEPAELVAHYERYSGTRIVIEGEVASSDEMTVMYLPSMVRDAEGREGMLVVLSETVTSKPGPLEKRFVSMLKKKGRVDAILEGHFEGAPGRRWGHQLCCRFRLQVERVISLKKRP